KVTSSSQEWCGQTFTQLNLTDEGYRAQLNSYFETEGDEVKNLPKVWLENELWNLIRIDPKKLPSGDIKVIPDLVFQRFQHVVLEAANASANLTDDGEFSTYTLEYPAYERTLSITFSTKFPHTIEKWEEVQKRRGKALTTKATKMKSIMSAYWGQNSLSDSHLRKELKLD
ncbi:MAG: septum formation inhibitor Maf, partial [Bacteroidota bacterium]